jgi:DinB superfamily
MAARGSVALTRWRREAVRRMAASRESTLALVARLPEREILRPRTQDRWSVKDVLTHLLSCDEETLRRFRLIARGHGDRIRWFESMADADRFNARSVARARRLGLRTVLRRMARVRAELIMTFERLPTDALGDPSHAYTVVQWLPAPGWSHERDHVSEIRAWWRGQRTAQAGRRPRGRATGGP